MSYSIIHHHVSTGHLFNLIYSLFLILHDHYRTTAQKGKPGLSQFSSINTQFNSLIWLVTKHCKWRHYYGSDMQTMKHTRKRERRKKTQTHTHTRRWWEEVANLGVCCQGLCSLTLSPALRSCCTISDFFSHENVISKHMFEHEASTEQEASVLPSQQVDH